MRLLLLHNRDSKWVSRPKTCGTESHMLLFRGLLCELKARMAEALLVLLFALLHQF